jgi:hypothetical protein
MTIANDVSNSTTVLDIIQFGVEAVGVSDGARVAATVSR